MSAAAATDELYHNNIVNYLVVPDGVEVPAVFTPYEQSIYLNEPLDYTELSEYISEYNGTHPVNETFFTDEIMERYKERVENGTMTQEEFDSYLDGLDEYATILYYTE